MGSDKTSAIAANFSDPGIRLVKESDDRAIAELFRLNYGEEYAFPEVFDGTWVKKCVYNDDIIGLVLEENGEVVGSGALVLDVGNYRDQIGELGRFVVNPRYHSKGQGQRIIEGLFQAAESHVEFAVGEARTIHSHSQRMVEKAGFKVIGFLPLYFSLCGRGENCILYGKLYGNGRSLRSTEAPRLIPEIAPLAIAVLDGMGLGSDIQICDASTYPNDDTFSLMEVDRSSLARLAQIREGRLVEPLLFGKLSLDEGHSFVQRRNAIYLMAVDEVKRPCGAIGYRFDETNRILTGLELVATSESVRGQLCRSLLGVAAELKARIIEVNISAYDPRLQATFLKLGFMPFGYAPSMVFHGTRRLDVVKMMRLTVPYSPNAMDLTEQARSILSVVSKSLEFISDPNHADHSAQERSASLVCTSEAIERSFKCPNVRYVIEEDIPEIIELFRMRYGDDAPDRDVYEGKPIRRTIHNRDMVGLVYIEQNKVAASVALQFDFGGISDQVGKISGFVHYARFNQDWVAHSLLNAVIEAAADNLEFVLGDLIVDTRFVQDQCELAGLSPLGYLPRYWEVGLLNRGVLPYGKLLGNGAVMRSDRIPHLIPEVAELATFVLNDMCLSTKVEIESNCTAYNKDCNYEFRRLDRAALSQLAQIEEGRLTEPLIFGNVSLDQGYSMLQRKKARYLMAVRSGRPVGAIGLQHDPKINVVRATELIGRDDGLRRFLCEEFLRYSMQLGARVIEADISAYHPRLQQTFLDLGCKPVGYFPAKVFRGTERLDVVKMMKLNAPYYELGQLMLTDKARRVFNIVEKGFL